MLPYARFNTPEDAAHLLSLLQEHSIPYEMTHEVNQLDNIYLGDALDQLYVLKIPREQFMPLHQVLTAEAKKDYHSAGFTHYFDSFNEHELQEVIDNPNEWNVYDAEIARLKLDQTKAVNPSVAASIAYTKAYTPVNISLAWLMLGYLISLSFFGLMLGSFIMKSKKTLQNGASVYMYNESSRKHGLVIFVLGIIGSLLFFSRILNQ